jgi:preprotein translocase subunit SecY
MKLKNYLLAFKIKDLRKKILFIFFIFAIFRLLANIPVPGVDKEAVKEFFSKFQAFGLLNLFTGGALERISIVMLGLGPYIIAIVILQLLTLIFPSLEKLYKEGGKEGREKFEQYARILTFPLSVFQSFGMLQLFVSQGILPPFSPLGLISSVLTISAGTLLLMWLGELISEKGLGNGVSLLIFAGIAADFPNNLFQILTTFEATQIFSLLLFFAISILIIISVCIVNEARRKIPITYAKRVRGARLFGGVSTYLPIPLNPAGVMPIIFALSLLTFPSTIAHFFAGNKIAQSVVNFFNNFLIHSTLYFLLVFVFTFFYTFVIFDPKTLSENLQKFGGFIPGIRPGKQTQEYLSFVLTRILVFGGVFLGIIAISPQIVQSITNIHAFSFLVGGTSLLILVSVILDTVAKLKTEIEMREYENI